MSQDNLKQKATSGIIWTAVQKYSTMTISFIAGMILARLLTPEDFGSIGMPTADAGLLSAYKKLKQNFPLKYFLGDNVNAIEIQMTMQPIFS